MWPELAWQVHAGAMVRLGQARSALRSQLSDSIIALHREVLLISHQQSAARHPPSRAAVRLAFALPLHARSLTLPSTDLVLA